MNSIQLCASVVFEQRSGDYIDSSTKCTKQGVLLDVGSLLIKKCQFSAICTKERKENH
jgi:hypothetical protein